MSATSPSPNYAATILEAGKALERHVSVIDTPVGPYLVVPEGVETESLADSLPTPRILTQAVTVDTPSSFIDYVRLFAAGDRRPVIFADLRGKTAELTAILDYHAAPDQPSWNRHRVTLPLAFARPFAEWYGKHGTSMTQTDFAAFVEGHIAQIAEPTGATLHEMCLKFEAVKNVEFKSYQRVSDGSVQFTYNEDVQGTVVGSAMKMPTTMTLVLPVYDDMPAVAIVAKIRFRVEAGGKLVLWYELQTIEDLIETARVSVTQQIASELTDVVRGVIAGRP